MPVPELGKILLQPLTLANGEVSATPGKIAEHSECACNLFIIRRLWHSDDSPTVHLFFTFRALFLFTASVKVPAVENECLSKIRLTGWVGGGGKHGKSDGNALGKQHASRPHIQCKFLSGSSAAAA